MKYWLVFCVFITMLFGGICYGAIVSSQEYLADAYRNGCCSSHGGIAYCGNSGYYVCKDGTRSPSCRCKK